MRLFALTLLLTLTACPDGLAPPTLDDGFGMNDMAVSLGDLAGADFAGADFAIGPDLASTDLAGSCATACDCAPGTPCQAGRCMSTSTTQVFCCGSATCPGNNLCQESSGQVSQCSLNPDAGFNVMDGGTGACGTQRCVTGAAGDVLCKLACGSLTATCVNTGGMEHCAP